MTRDIEEVELVSREPITGQRVGTRLKHGSAASWWRRLDQVDFLSISRLDSESHEGFRIGSPLEPSVEQTGFAVFAERDFFGLAVVAEEEAMVLDERDPFSIGRAAPVEEFPLPGPRWPRFLVAAGMSRLDREPVSRWYAEQQTCYIRTKPSRTSRSRPQPGTKWP